MLHLNNYWCLYDWAARNYGKAIAGVKKLHPIVYGTQIGLSTRAYSKIEIGETQLTIIRLNEISRVLGIEPMEILGFDHNNIFNNCIQEGDNSTMGTSNYLASDKLMQQYELRIQQLESEVVFLRTLIK